MTPTYHSTTNPYKQGTAYDCCLLLQDHAYGKPSVQQAILQCEVLAQDLFTGEQPRAR
jgi:hypothetical protein